VFRLNAAPLLLQRAGVVDSYSLVLLHLAYNQPSHSCTDGDITINAFALH
jgi:hypothetical protein